MTATVRWVYFDGNCAEYNYATEPQGEAVLRVEIISQDANFVTEQTFSRNNVNGVPVPPNESWTRGLTTDGLTRWYRTRPKVKVNAGDFAVKIRGAGIPGRY